MSKLDMAGKSFELDNDAAGVANRHQEFILKEKIRKFLILFISSYGTTVHQPLSVFYFKDLIILNKSWTVLIT